MFRSGSCDGFAVARMSRSGPSSALARRSAQPHSESLEQSLHHILGQLDVAVLVGDRKLQARSVSLPAEEATQLESFGA